jgi:hypothetical protein
VYFAYADRPGFETAYYNVTEDLSPDPIQLNATSPAVLAEIALSPSGGSPPEGGGHDELAPSIVRDLMNVPNPFTASTTIQYALESETIVSLEIFDSRGRLVRRLLDGAPQGAGEYAVPWDRQDDGGGRVSAGIYFTCVRTESTTVARKVVVLP